MKKRLSMLIALVIAAAFVLAACSSSASSADNAKKLMAEMNSMIKILQDNKANPEKAMKDLNAYKEKNKAEFNKLKQDLGNYMKANPKKTSALAAAYMLKNMQLENLTAEMNSKIKAQK